MNMEAYFLGRQVIGQSERSLQGACMNRMLVSLPQNLHVEALTLSMAIFGDGTSKEVIKVV